MKQRLLFIINLFIFFSGTLSAQVITKHIEGPPSIKNNLYSDEMFQFLRIRVGPSIPIKDYGSNSSSSAGFATLGYNFDLAYGRKFSRSSSLGIEGVINYHSHGFDTEGYSAVLSRTNPGVSFYTTAGSWSILNFMAGIYSNTPLSPGKSSINLNFLIGTQSVQSPSVFFTGSSSKGSGSVSIDQADGTAFVIQFGGSMIFSITETISFVIGLDYMNSKADFPSVQIHSSNGNSGTAQISQPIDVLSVSGGIVIKVR